MKEHFQNVLNTLNKLGNTVFCGDIAGEPIPYFRFSSKHIHVIVEVDQSFGEFKFTYDFYCNKLPCNSVLQTNPQHGYEQIKKQIQSIIDDHKLILSEL